jgi:hypothetical protein
VQSAVFADRRHFRVPQQWERAINAGRDSRVGRAASVQSAKRALLLRPCESRLQLPRRTGARPPRKSGTAIRRPLPQPFYRKFAARRGIVLSFIARPCPGRPNPKQETKMRDFAGISAPIRDAACDGRYWARTRPWRSGGARLPVLLGFGALDQLRFAQIATKLARFAALGNDRSHASCSSNSGVSLATSARLHSAQSTRQPLRCRIQAPAAVVRATTPSSCRSSLRWQSRAQRTRRAPRFRIGAKRCQPSRSRECSCPPRTGS